MDNDGKIPAKDKGHFERPMGGPEPSVQGDTRGLKKRSTPIDVGYDHSSSRPGKGNADLQRGYSKHGGIDAGSDGMEGV